MSGYYAANGQISRRPIKGGIEITREQYKKALDAKLKGNDLRVVDGAMEIYTPSRERKTYWLPPAEEHQTEPGEEPPENAVLTEPPDGFHVIEDGQWVYSLELEREAMVMDRYQARVKLLRDGVLDRLEKLMDDPDTDPEVRLAWRELPSYRRNHPRVIELLDLLGYDIDEQKDEAFRAGMQIEA